MSTIHTTTEASGDVPRFELRHRMGLALEHADLSVQAMADHLEVSRNTVGNYLAGRTAAPTPTLRVWALRCGVPYRWLRDGEPSDGGPEGTRDKGFPETNCTSVLAFRPRHVDPASVKAA